MQLEDDYGLLMARTHRALRSRFTRELGRHGITFEHYQTLLGLSEGEGVPQRVVADRLALEPTYTARMLHRVEKAGLIERRPDENDGRVRCVYTTTRGQEVWGIARAIRQRTLPQAMSCLTDVERQQLRRLLNTIHDHVTALMEQPDQSE